MPRQKTPKKGGNSPVLSLRPNIRRFLCSQSSQDHSLINSPVPSPQPARSPTARAPPQPRARDAPRPAPSPGRRHGQDIRNFAVNTCAFPPQRPPCSPPGPGTPPRGGARGPPRWVPPRRRRVPKVSSQKVTVKVPRTVPKRTTLTQGRTPRRETGEPGRRSPSGGDTTSTLQPRMQVGPPISDILIAQLNLNLRHDARGNMDKSSSSVQLLQEPPYKRGGVASLEARHLISYSHSSGGDPEQRPRAAIRVSKNLISVGMESFWGRDLVVCMIKGSDFSVVFASLYCDVSRKPAIENNFERLVKYCKEKSLPLIVGADSNAHSTYWGPSQNRRGQEFEFHSGKRAFCP